MNMSRDILQDWRITGIAFGLPILAIVASGLPGVAESWQTGIWVGSLVVMGAACIVNAFRCGRVHCYLTGPFFIVMAIVALFYGLGMLRLGAHGWSTISVAVIVGALLLCCVPEALFGRYRRRDVS